MTSTQSEPNLTVEPSVKELVNSVTKDISTLVSAQIELAKAEVKETVANTASTLVMFVVAGVFAFLGFIFLLVTLAYVLVQLGLPVWAGFGIVTLLLLIICLIVALIGKSKAGKIKGPEKTIEQIDETKTALSNLRSDPETTPAKK